MEFDDETIKIFLDDSREGLGDMARELVLLEENPEDLEVLASIFRTLHSLKGNAALMEYRRLSTLAHAGESLLGRLRKGELRLTPEMITTLLTVLDRIRDTLSAIEQTRQEGEESHAELEAELEQHISGAGAAPALSAPAPEPVPPAATAEEEARRSFREEGEPLIQLCSRDLAALRQQPANIDLLNSLFRGLRKVETLAGAIGDVDGDLAAELCVALDRIINPLRKRKAEATAELIAVLERGVDTLGTQLAGPDDEGADSTEPSAMLAELEITARSVEREGSGGAPAKPKARPGGPSPKAQVLRVDVKKVDALMNLVGEYVIGSSRLEQQIADLSGSLTRLQDLLESGRQQLSPISSTDLAARVVNDIRRRRARMAERDLVYAPMDGRPATSGSDTIVPEQLGAWQGMTELVSDHGRLLEDVVESREELDQVFSQLQEGLLRVRMMPVATVFQKFPRIVRDLRTNLGKEIKLIVTGDETEVDKSIVEVLSDPLMHIIRNSADHGIEEPEERTALGKPQTGTIHLSATQEGNQIVVRVADDGRGLDAVALKTRALELGLLTKAQVARMSDREAYALIFHAGFSTARVVTELSGRGVGMDVVKENLARIKGTIAIESKLGQGTTVSLKLPLTLAIVNALVVAVRGHSFAIPLANVTETIMLSETAVRSAGQKEIFALRGHMESLVRLEDFLELPHWSGSAADERGAQAQLNRERPVVLVESLEKRVGLMVDEVRARKEIVIKPLGDFMAAIRCLAGATILGDGRVVPILDIGQIVQEVVGGITTGDFESGLVSA